MNEKSYSIIQTSNTEKFSKSKSHRKSKPGINKNKNYSSQASKERTGCLHTFYEQDSCLLLILKEVTYYFVLYPY